MDKGHTKIIWSAPLAILPYSSYSSEKYLVVELYIRRILNILSNIYKDHNQLLRRYNIGLGNSEFAENLIWYQGFGSQT